jgi:hypothetical protein
VKESAPGRGIADVWWNGDATFLGNPIGDKPNGEGLYRFYDAGGRWPEFADFDYAGWYEKVMRPIARAGRRARLAAVGLFHGRDRQPQPAPTGTRRGLTGRGAHSAPCGFFTCS